MVLTQHAPTSNGSATDGVGGVTLEWVTVTPDMAREWLRRNKANRRMKPSVVKHYARQMTAGLWREDSPEPIIFDRDGDLINGQHRLEGIIEADKPIRLLVARGVSRDTRLSLDTGISRTGGDALQMTHPEMNGNRASCYAAAIRGLEAWARDTYKGPHEAIAYRIPNRTLVDLLPKYQDGFERLYTAAETIHHAPVRGGVGLWLIMLYRFAQIDFEGTLEFADKVATGANLPVGSPIVAIRDRLNQMPGKETKLRRQLVARLIVYGWNAWRRGANTKLTKVAQYAGTPFPTPIANQAEYLRLMRERVKGDT